MKTAPKLSQRTRLKVERLEIRDCPASYSIIDLVPPPGGLTFSEAYDLNDSSVAVGRGLQNSGYGRAAVWPVAAGTARAGAYLELPAGHNHSDAITINNAGMIGGSSGVVSSFSQAVVWVGAGTTYAIRELDSLGGNFINNSVVGLSEPDANSHTWAAGASNYSDVSHATIWQLNASGTTVTTLDLEPNASYSWANDVRVDGNRVYVTGEYFLNASSSQARVWELDLDGNILSRTDLGTLGGPTSAGFSRNQDGHVVGSSTVTSGGSYAFLYRNNTMINLGSLGNRNSSAAAVNDDDVVVGTYHNKTKSSISEGGTPYAFVWRDNTMYDLRSQLSGTGRSTWPYLQDANDINTDGQIVGHGAIKKGSGTQHHGFLMIPPALNASGIAPMEQTTTLTIDQVRPLLTEAITRWKATGVDTSSLKNLNIRITDLPGTTLGQAQGNTITLDSSAAGWGWFVDKSPRSDAEFRLRGNQGEQGRMDLLSVLMHEMGHVLGYEHHNVGVMQDTLTVGERILPVGMSSFRTHGNIADMIFVMIQERKLRNH